LDEDIFEEINTLTPSPRGELELTAALTRLAGRREVAVIEAGGPWLAIRTVQDLLAAQLILWPEGKDFIAGRPLRLDAEAKVGPGAALGAACEVGAHAVVEGSLLLDHVRVGDGGGVYRSVLGEGVVVADGAVVNGAAVGDGARIGERAQLTPGTRVWPGVRVPPGERVSGDVT